MVKTILKGIVIGIANIIPGVSGGTMAVSMGIYDKLIHAVTHIRKEFKEGIRFLIPVLLGAAIGLVGLSFIIEAMFQKVPIQTNLLFIGLIVGGLPVITQKVKGKTISVSQVCRAVCFFVLVVGLAAIGEREGSAAVLDTSLLSLVKLFFMGLIAAATMVIPGVSGSMILMILGYYHSIITAINDFIRSALHLDVQGIVDGVMILFPFGVGVLLGIVLIAKCIDFIFQRYPLHAYWAIIGLIGASPIGIVLMQFNIFMKIDLLSGVTGAAALAVGIVIARKLGD